MRKETPVTDTVTEYICDLCNTSYNDFDNVYRCQGCKRDFCIKTTCYKSLYPLTYVFNYPYAICSDCYFKIDMFIAEAQRLKIEYEEKQKGLKNNIKEVLHVK